MVGVNGVGKTTTLGKLANLAVRSGYSCLVAAGDTFRAAAVQQLQVWADRSGVPLVANPSANADPAAVVFDAIGAAQSKDIELLLVDTAGRLQTKNNLMEELAKVRRIVDRLAPDAAVESLLVLDASQGQNGLASGDGFRQGRWPHRCCAHQARWHSPRRCGVCRGLREQPADPLHRSGRRTARFAALQQL